MVLTSVYWIVIDTQNHFLPDYHSWPGMLVAAQYSRILNEPSQRIGLSADLELPKHIK